MKGFLFRDWLATGLLAAGVVLGGMALSEPAWPGEVGVKGDLFAVAPTAPTVPLPRAKPTPCAVPFQPDDAPEGWRFLTGDKAIRYITVAFTAPPPIDTVAYTIAGDKAAVVFALNGCVVARRVIAATVHGKIMDIAIGWIA